MATASELSAIVMDVVAYFQTKPPSDKTIDLWLKKLGGLNLLASRARIVDIITNGDVPPRNFPAVVKGAYSTWLRDQPRERNEGGCRYCFRGLLHAKKDGNVYTFRCGYCNTAQSPYPTMTRYQLAEHGYSLDWHHDFDGPIDRETVKNIRDVANYQYFQEKRRESDPLPVPF